MIKLFMSTEVNDPVSAIIRWRTTCDWSHTGFLRVEDGFTFSAMSDGKGIAWRPPNPKAKLLIIDAEGSEEALAKALAHEGKGYDFLSILGIALGKNWQTPGKFICDRLVFWAFQEIGKPLLNHTFIPLLHLTPADILLSPNVKEAR